MNLHNFTVKTVFFSTQEGATIMKTLDTYEDLVRIGGSSLCLSYWEFFFLISIAFPRFSEDSGIVATCYASGKKEVLKLSNLILVFNGCAHWPHLLPMS